jgi:cytochrome c-type biogenesis protein CcmF
VAALVGLWAGLGAAKLLPALAFAGSAWIICGAAAEIVNRIRLFRVPLRDSLSRFAGLRLSVFGTALGHAGLGVTVAGIAGMSLATERVVALHPGESVEANGYTWTLQNLRDAPGPNYQSRIATIEVTKDGQPFLTLEPSRRSFPVQRMTTTEAAIHTNGVRDLYAVLGEERDGVAVLRLHDNFLAPWIWFGALIMASGGLMSLIDRRIRVGAPARAATRPGQAVA